MPYLNCPACRLSLSVDESAPQDPDCPRCMRRDGEAIPMSLSADPHRMFTRGLHELADAVVKTKQTRGRLD